jgi:hypothetical protein
MKRFFTLCNRFGWKQARSFYKDQLEIPTASNALEISNLRRETIKKEQEPKNDEAYRVLVKLCALLIHDASFKGKESAYYDFPTKSFFEVDRLEQSILDRVDADLKSKGFFGKVRNSSYGDDIFISISWQK